MILFVLIGGISNVFASHQIDSCTVIDTLGKVSITDPPANHTYVHRSRLHFKAVLGLTRTPQIDDQLQLPNQTETGISIAGRNGSITVAYLRTIVL